MMEKNLNKDTAKEILTVLAFCENDFINRIPKNVISELANLAADSDNNYYIASNKDLLSQDISDDCLDYLCLLYLNYVE